MCFLKTKKNPQITVIQVAWNEEYVNIGKNYKNMLLRKYQKKKKNSNAAIEFVELCRQNTLLPEETFLLHFDYLQLHLHLSKDDTTYVK